MMERLNNFNDRELKVEQSTFKLTEKREGQKERLS
jgi:hypothetical protein